MITRITQRLVLPGLAAIAVIGCGARSDGPAREPVSGSVTLDGQPLASGEITFVPQEGEPVGGVIRDGRYQIGRSGGPTHGPSTVRIYARVPTGKKVPSDDQPGEFVEVTQEAIPDRYNLKSELKAEVAPGADNQFDFELLSKAADASRSTRR